MTESRARPLTPRQLALAAALLYIVLIGGTNVGTYVTAFAAVNAVIATALVGLWLVELPRNNDLTDRLLLVAVLAFLLTCVTSAFPRMSFEAATSVIAALAAFGIARGELANMRAERAMITVLAMCALVLGIGLLAVWVPVWVAWWQGTGSPPPLDLQLPPGPYRHYHIAAMLLAMLLPAALQLRARKGALPIAIAASLCAVGVVFMSGSRTAWAALLVVGIVALVLRLRLKGTLIVAFGISAGAAVAALALVGALSSVSSRLLNTFTLAIRAETWSGALASWLERPLTGWGPGSFPAVFRFRQELPIFPDPGGHAHNVLVQTTLESGLVGLVALAAAGAGLAIGIWRHKARSPYALAGLALFGLMSLTDLPSNFPMVLVVGIGWAALAASRAASLPEPARPPRIRWRLAASGVVGCVIVVAVASTLMARVAFDEAHARLNRGDLAGAREALERSVAFDPSMALYWRERGTRAEEAGDHDDARRDLERAQQLNSGDPTTLRALAVLAVNEGRLADAVQLAMQAVTLRGTHPQDHLLLAWVATEAGDDELATRGLTGALTWYPWTAAAPTWEELFGPVTISELRQTEAAWDAAGPDRQRSWEATWLGAMTGAGPTADLSPGLAAVDAVLSCDPSRASDLLADAGSAADGRDGLAARLMLASLASDEAAYRSAVRVALLRRNELANLARVDPGPTTPFSDYEEDIGLYKRLPLTPAELEPMLPTGGEGLAAWLQDPRGAARRAAPGSGLAHCAD